MEIPENMTYSILPVLRWEVIGGDYKVVTISNSIKVTRFTDCSLLAEILFHSLKKACLVYDLSKIQINLFMMGRPWLNSNDFNSPFDQLNKTLDENIKKEIYFKEKNKINYLNKLNLLKDYEFKNIFMDNYGEPVYNKNNNLIGYKLDFNKYATVETFYN